ncbi:MAG: hypothetical protein JNL83_31340 [Myxococcales bacterium]|nr:hypothetical protein [Myxococcales bacterium]
MGPINRITAAAAALALLDACLPAFSCDNAACIDGAEIVLPYTAPMASLEGGRVHVCRGDVCSDAVTGAVTFQFSVNDLEITSAFFQDSTLRMTVPSAGKPLGDGDVYTVELRDNAGTVVASKQWVAVYQDLDPNGEDCGPHCRFAHLE